jgi:hypothetical protein
MMFRTPFVLSVALLVAVQTAAQAAPHPTPSPCRESVFATANCENGYDATKHKGRITSQCRTNGAIAVPQYRAQRGSTHASHAKPTPSPSAPPCRSSR